MKGLKKFSPLILSSFALLSLVGCGKKDNSQVQVVWWNNYTDENVVDNEQYRSDPKYNEYFYAKDVIAEFEKENPDIHVQTVYKPGKYDGLRDAVLKALPNGGQPTIVSGYPDSAALFNSQSGEPVYDCADWVKENLEGDKDTDFIQDYLRLEKEAYGGKYLSMPYSKSGEIFAINQTVFDQVGAGACGSANATSSSGYVAPVAETTKAKYEVPENIYDAMKLAKEMQKDFPKVFYKTDKDGNLIDKDGNATTDTSKYVLKKTNDNYFEAVPFCWDSTQNMFITMLENNGISYTDSSKATLSEKLTWNCDEGKEIAVQIKKWNNEGLFATQDVLMMVSEGKYHEYSSAQLTSGRCFMTVSSTTGTRYYATNDNFTVSLHHGLNGKDNSKAADAKIISQGPSLIFFKGKEGVKDKDGNVTRLSENEAAMKFYKFLTNTTNSANLAVKTSYFPLRTSSSESSAVKTLTDALKTPITGESTKQEKINYYQGSALKMDQTYNSKSNYFISDVFDKSAITRTKVGDMMSNILKDNKATTDEEIKKLVDDEFKKAAAAISTEA